MEFYITLTHHNLTANVSQISCQVRICKLFLTRHNFRGCNPPQLAQAYLCCQMSHSFVSPSSMAQESVNSKLNSVQPGCSEMLEF